MLNAKWMWPLLLAGAVVAVACGSTSEPLVPTPNPEEAVRPPPSDDEDDGTTPPVIIPTPVDAGDVTPDAGKPDAGVKPDAGTTPDAGNNTAFDAGTELDAGQEEVDAGLPPINFPTTAGWDFYGPQHGLPLNILGVSADEGGNIWVAGGTAGLFLMRAGATSFERFTMADGLRPYGYMADGSEPPGAKYLNVISVEGGPAGTVFVGYKGKPPAAGQFDCEENWDRPNPDPSVYKSGDADRVTLTSSGISVVHYDIFTGPGIVKDEMRGREKVCDIYSILWDKAANLVYFGGNHGFLMGKADYAGNPTCNGQLGCTGVYEHLHPLVAGVGGVTLSGAYRAMDLTSNHDVFVGADVRSTLFKIGSNGGVTSWSAAQNAYWKAQPQSENDTSNHFDIWPDTTSPPSGSDPKSDIVFGVANAGDDTFWVGSASQGLARVSIAGVVLGSLKTELVAPHVSGVARDTNDGSIWAGARWGGGVSRLKNGGVEKYGMTTFGVLAHQPVTTIESAGSGTTRKILVGFDTASGKPGAVGIYSGN